MVSFLLTVSTIAPAMVALNSAGVPWRIALIVITVSAFLLLIVRLVQAVYSQQLRVRSQELAALRTQLDESLGALNEAQETFQRYRIVAEREREELGYIADRISEYQSVRYEEELEIVTLVAEDKVVEHHRTRPVSVEEAVSRLPYRTLRPILSYDPTVTYADFGLRGRIDHDNGVSFDVRLLTQNRQAVRLIALFSPAIEEETAWTLEYVSPRLWRPLRETGRDELAWSASSPGPARDVSPFTVLRVVFVFPAGTRTAAVREESGRGAIERDDSYPLGPALIWRIDNPPPVRFRWEVSCPDLPRRQG